jgi:hypothetical protein
VFTAEAMERLLKTKPFVPFRLILSDGGSVDVPTPEVALLGQRFVVVGKLDPKTNYKFIEWWTMVYYLHVSRVEYLAPGQPPFTSPPSGSGTPSPAPL